MKSKQEQSLNRRLPNGKMIQSITRYCREWNRIAQPVAKRILELIKK